jgi:hypothetical protein
MHRPLNSLTWQPGSPELYCSPGARLALGQECCHCLKSSNRFGAVSGFCDKSESPVSTVYPLHVQREIDRRWLQRSEETASVRALKVIDFFRGAAAVTRKGYNVSGLPPCSRTAAAV